MIRKKTKSRAGFSTEGLRFYQVHGDNMAPTIHHRDFVLLAPVDSYIGEGYYLINNTFNEPVAYSCSGFGGTREEPEIRLQPHNKFYPAQSIPRAKFDEMVFGKVAMICRVVDHHLLPNEGALG